jgi:hypothetical protein
VYGTQRDRRINGLQHREAQGAQGKYLILVIVEVGSRNLRAHLQDVQNPDIKGGDVRNGGLVGVGHHEVGRGVSQGEGCHGFGPLLRVTSNLAANHERRVISQNVGVDNVVPFLQ